MAPLGHHTAAMADRARIRERKKYKYMNISGGKRAFSMK